MRIKKIIKKKDKCAVLQICQTMLVWWLRQSVCPFRRDSISAGIWANRPAVKTILPA